MSFFKEIEKLLKYEGYLTEVMAELDAIEKAKPGDQVMVHDVRTRIGKRLVEIPAHAIKVLE